MSMFDTLQQKGSAIGGAVPQVGGANGGSFAQKQQMKANPIMKGRPAVQGAPMGAPAGVGQGVPVQKPANPFGAAPGMTPNATGARPALAPPAGMMGMKGPRKPIGGTMATPLGGSPQNYNPMQSPDLAQPIPKAPSGLMTPQLPNLVPPQSEGATTGGLAAMDPNQMQGSVGQQAPPFGGMQPGSPSFQAMIEQLGQARPDMMRGLGPSGGGMTSLYGTTPEMNQSFGQPMQGMTDIMNQPQQPVQMDENGLEPRRGAR